MTSWPGAVIAGAAGLLIGGYVTVLIERVPASRTISGSFSELTRHPLGECPHCAAALGAADIVPLLGWARTGGACRHCGEAYGAWHPAAELLTAFLFALLGLRFGVSPVLPAYLYLAAVAVALAFIDVAHRRLPDMLTLPSYLVAFALLGVATPFTRHGAGHLIHAFIGLACASAFYLILALDLPGRHRLGRRQAVRAARPVPWLDRARRARPRRGRRVRAGRRGGRRAHRGGPGHPQVPDRVRPVHAGRRDRGDRFPGPVGQRSSRDPAGPWVPARVDETWLRRLAADSGRDCTT